MKNSSAEVLSDYQIIEAFADELPSIVKRNIRILEEKLLPIRQGILQIQSSNHPPSIKEVLCKSFIITSGYESEIKRLQELKKLLKTYKAMQNPSQKIDMQKIIAAKAHPIENIYKFDKLRRTGNRISASCPFHSDKTPSFVIYPNNKFHCFSCQERGSSIDFYIKINNLSDDKSAFRKAVEALWIR